MNAHEMGTKWGKSVTVLARKEFLKWAPGTESASELKKALLKAEDETPDYCDPFKIEDGLPIDEAWIKEFCDGVRSVETGAESGWV